MFVALCFWMGCVPPDGAVTHSAPSTSDGPQVTAPDDTGSSTTGAVSARLHDDIGSIVVVSWEQETAATIWAEYAHDPGDGDSGDDDSGDGADWQATPRYSARAGPQELLLLGVPYGASVDWRVQVDDGRGAREIGAGTTTTQGVPSALPDVTVTSADAERWEPTGRHLALSITGASGMWRIIIDRQGRVVWAQENPTDVSTYYTRLSADGDDLLWDQTNRFDAQSGAVVRGKIDGSVVSTTSTPNIHHAFTELPDETILWGAYSVGDGGLAETLESVGTDGARATLWSSPGTGWSSNALFWSESNDTLLYSFYTNMTVLEIERETGAVLHTWGQEGDWAFVPESSRFDWQHGVTLTESGTLLLSTHASADSNEGVSREYEIDAETQALVEVWSFGVGDGVGAPYYGEAHRLPGGNTMQNYGTNLRIRETTPEGEVVWDVEWESSVLTGWDITELIGRSIWLPNLYDLLPVTRAATAPATPPAERPGARRPSRTEAAADPER